MKKFNYILMIIAIINIIFAFILFNKEGIAINVNSKNKEIVTEALKAEISNVDNVTKIILGNGWNSGKLTIYHSLGKTETIYIKEGVFKLRYLEEYIRENGYNLDNMGFILIGISILIVIYLFVYRYINGTKLES